MGGLQGILHHRRFWLAPALWAYLSHTPASASNTDPTELAAHVRAERWLEVRAAAAAQPQPWAPEMALAVARAERLLGHADRAEEHVRRALPRAGALAPALRLEAAAAALALGKDPWPWVQPLLGAPAERAQRRAAAETLRRAWEVLPLRTLQAARQRPLPRALRRQLDAITASRTGNVHAALSLLAERHDDEPAARASAFLATQPLGAAGQRLLVGQGLLASGRWREAERYLSPFEPASDPAQRYQHAFLYGRALYRLGRVGEAAGFFQQAEIWASGLSERHAAAVQRARCAELMRHWEMAEAAWETARLADPTAPAGWEGVARARLMRGEEGVCSALAAAPAGARTLAAERLAAVVLVRSGAQAARACLAHADSRSPRARLLMAAERRQNGREEEARKMIVAFLADVSAGTWREMALRLASVPLTPREGEAEAARDLGVLSSVAASWGPEAARTALAVALAADPAWAPILAGGLPSPLLPPHLEALVRVGLESEAARLYAVDFPTARPVETAWSARALAAWGNGPAALLAGEKVWQSLGRIPAGLLPEAVTRAIFPLELLASVREAAHAAGISPALLAGVIRQESRFDAFALSPAGARGLAQLVPETARRLGAREEDLWNPALSLTLAARELARLQEIFGNRPAVVAAAYNAGEAVVATWLAVLGENYDEVAFTAAIPYQETSTYVRAVLEGVSLARHLGE